MAMAWRPSSSLTATSLSAWAINMLKAAEKLKRKYHWLLAGVLVITVSGLVLFNHLEIARGYTAYGDKFIVQNNLGAEIFSIDDSGVASDQGGALTWDPNSAQLPTGTKPFDWSDGFELRSPAGQIVFYVEDDGTVHLDGSLNENQGDLAPVGADNLIFQNQDGE